MQVILRSNETDNIRVCDVDLSEFQVFTNGERQLGNCQVSCRFGSDRVGMVDVRVVEKRTSRLLATNHTRGSKARKSYPTPKRYKETEPSKEKHTTIHIDGIEPGNGASFPVDRIDHWGPP